MVVARDEPTHGSAENRLGGVVARMERGALATEVVVRLCDGLDICAIISDQSRRRLGLAVGDRARVEFTAFSVILDAE